MDIISNSPVLIHVRLGEKHYVVNNSDKSYDFHRMDDVSCSINDKKLLFTSKNPFTPVNIEFIADDSGVKINKSLSNINTASPKNISISFLANIISGDIDTAYSYLSSTLQRSFY